MNNKKNGKIGIIVTIIILIILVFISNLKLNKFWYIESLFSKIINPIQYGITHITNKLTGNNQFFSTIEELQQENSELVEKNEQLETQLRQLEIIQAENTTLKEYLKIAEQYKNYDTIPAYIISKDISNYSKIFIINAGSKDGILENMTVIGSEGLVGHIISVTENSAKVQTLPDTSNVVSATLENSKDTVICRGMLDSNKLRATYVSTSTILTEGEKLYTSGMGGIYPKGIYIGKISKINETKNITNRNFEVEAAVDFENLETVLVITNK